MNEESEKLLQVIFQEGHVIDVDFSVWDQSVSIVVVGGLVGENFTGQGPIHNVAFVDVTSLIWTTRHVGVTLDSRDDHCQWTILEGVIRREAHGLIVEMKGFVAPAPDLTIHCGDVSVTEIPIEVIDRVNPRWNRPYCPFARPSLMELDRFERKSKTGKN